MAAACRPSALQRLPSRPQPASAVIDPRFAELIGHHCLASVTFAVAGTAVCRVWRWPPRCLDVCDKLSLNLASIPQLGVLMEGHMQVKGKVDSCSIPQLSPALSYPQLAPSSVAKVALESFGALAILYKTFSFDPAGVRLVQRCHGDDRTSRTRSRILTRAKRKVLELDGHAVSPQSGNPHRYTLIYLHGLGGCGADYLHADSELCWPWRLGPSYAPGLRAVFPSAPLQQQPWGETLPSWYQYQGIASNELAMPEQLAAVQEALDEVIRQEIERLEAPGCVFLGGVSQGCNVALLTRPGRLRWQRWLPSWRLLGL
ncbi:unnamed protein product [Durusdinium trenchii]|uniref:Phospholipase/carboxylesterase/thioesterase domain-containing protein n=1 Tax=Durusdinium trenchii TaxID=1381693 RepID=A0ABP0N5R6_9DINO